MSASRRLPPRGTREVQADPKDAPQRFGGERSCTVCGISLSDYNSGPHCYRHSVGMPWRGPSAKPKLD